MFHFAQHLVAQSIQEDRRRTADRIARRTRRATPEVEESSSTVDALIEAILEQAEPDTVLPTPAGRESPPLRRSA